MRRRAFLAGGCAACGVLAASFARAQANWTAPPRFLRPDVATDEGGLWALMDREETRIRRSPFAVRDAALASYLGEIVCRLAGSHCPDVRVHVLRTALFNASMAPNGMMMVWTGLLLRMENEAQLAAVLGHEIGHYLERHSIERLRDARSRSAFGQFLGLFGLVGAVGQLAMLAGMFGFSRDQERDADRIGIMLMRDAGYDPGEAARVWSNLLLEIKARPNGDPSRGSPLFATHPAPDERVQNLEALAQAAPGGETRTDRWLERMGPFRREWLHDEVRRGQPEESIALFTRMIERGAAQADHLFARAEVRRLRGREGDLGAAHADYLAAIAAGGEPPETHRGLGLILRSQARPIEARASFSRYLEAAPDAPDTALIKGYIEELGT